MVDLVLHGAATGQPKYVQCAVRRHSLYSRLYCRWAALQEQPRVININEARFSAAAASTAGGAVE
jgi:hypothetical protein